MHDTMLEKGAHSTVCASDFAIDSSSELEFRPKLQYARVVIAGNRTKSGVPGSARQRISRRSRAQRVDAPEGLPEGTAMVEGVERFEP